MRPMQIIVKNKLFLFTFLTVLLCLNNPSSALMPEDTVKTNEQDIFLNRRGAPSGEYIRQGEDKQDEMPKYAPGEIIIKFKPSKDTDNLKVKAHEKSDLKLTSDSIKKLKELPDRLKSLVKDDTTIEPVFKGLHRKMRLQKKTEAQINKEIFNKLSKSRKISVKEPKNYRLSDVYILRNVDTKGKSIEELCEELKTDPNIEYAEPNYLMELQMVPNDPYYHSQGSWTQTYDDLWGIKRVECERAWDISQGEGVIVAVIDTGVDYTHPDLKNNIWVNEDEIPNNNIDDDENGYVDDVNGYDISDGDNEPLDTYGHGSHVAGTIAAIGNNSIGVIGVAPRAKIMAVKIFDNSYEDVIVEGLWYAAANGARVLSNSWGPKYRYPSSPTIEGAIDDAYDNYGCVIVFAAGNANDDVAYYSPANYPKVITVAASTQNDEKCSFSNYGSKIDVSAPGGGYENELGSGWADIYNILSTMPDNCEIAQIFPSLKVSNGYWRLGGTSMACPHVSGIAALIISKNSHLDNELVRRIIQLSADDIGLMGKDDYFGYGRVNAYNALVVTDISNIEIDIAYPKQNVFVRDYLEIVGSASISDFQKFEVYCAPKDDPTNRTLIESSSSPVQNGILAVLDTMKLLETEYILTLVVFDGSGFALDDHVIIRIDNINQAPVLKHINDMSMLFGRVSQFKVEASDPDNPFTEWGRLKYSCVNLPDGSQFDPQTQVFSWQPGRSDIGTHEVIFIVEDSDFRVTQEVLISVSDVYIEEKPISIDPADQNWPVIYKDTIVWSDARNGYWDVYMYDLSHPEKGEIRITEDEFSQALPEIYENYIICLDYKYGLPGISIYNILTGEKKVLTTGFPSADFYPRIYKNTIVWKRTENFLSERVIYDICMYNISTGDFTRITNDTITRGEPDIYEDKIVWSDNRNGNKDIYMYDLTTSKDSQITIDPASQRFPSIYKDKIVWMDYRKESDYLKREDIYMYDMKTGKETRITNGVGLSQVPDIYEDKIVWLDYRDGESNIYLYDLATNMEIPITNTATNKYWPRIYENKIVWAECRNDSQQADIYLAEIHFRPQIISISPTVTLAGAFVSIIGKNFGYTQGDSTVQFENGTVCPIAKWSNNEITCLIPQNAETGLLKVVTKGGESNGVMVTVKRIALEGRVTDDLGNPIQGARVTVSQYLTNSMSKVAEATSDENGHYEIIQNLPTGYYWVTASLSGYYTDGMKIWIIEGQPYSPLNFRLREAPLLRVIIRDSVTYATLSGVSVKLKDAVTGNILPTFEKTTGSDGAFNVYLKDNVPQGSYYLVCSKAGYEMLPYYESLKVNIPGNYVYILMQGIGTVTGIVKDSRVGTPLSNISLKFQRMSNDYSYNVTTDSGGTFSLTLPADYYRLTMSGPYYNSSSLYFKLCANETKNMTIPLTSSCVVQGKVLDQSTGQAVLYVKVDLLKQDGTLLKTLYKSYRDEQYIFNQDIMAGTYKVRTSSAGYQTKEETVTFNTQGERKTVDIRLAKW